MTRSSRSRAHKDHPDAAERLKESLRGEDASSALAVVANADGMDKDTFIRHLVHRHEDSLAGVRFSGAVKLSDYVEDAYRSFHRHLHKFRTDLEHEHRTEPEQG